MSPETCRVKPLRIKNAIVASCWTYFTSFYNFNYFNNLRIFIICVHYLDNKLLDINDARCKHEVHVMSNFVAFALRTTPISFNMKMGL